MKFAVVKRKVSGILWAATRVNAAPLYGTRPSFHLNADNAGDMGMTALSAGD